MESKSIIALLIAERAKLNQAIAALQDGGTETGNLPENAPKKKRRVTSAARRKMALGQKKRWAALKAA